MTKEDFENEDGGLKDMIVYFWIEKGDPERYTGWDDDAVREHWPEFWLAWHQYKLARMTMNAICDQQ